MPLGTEQLKKMMGGVSGGKKQAVTVHIHVLNTSISSEFHVLINKHLYGPLGPECKFETLGEDKKLRNRKIYPRSLIQPVKEVPAQLFDKVCQVIALSHTKPCSSFLIDCLICDTGIEPRVFYMLDKALYH